MKLGTASKKTYDHQSSRSACASGQLEQDICNNKKNNKKKKQKKQTRKAVLSSTGPARDVLFP